MILTIFKRTFRSTKYIHIIAQPVSKTLFVAKLKLYTHLITIPFPLSATIPKSSFSSVLSWTCTAECGWEKRITHRG